jgi:ParB-like chromosome segregation protein Spo0J
MSKESAPSMAQRMDVWPTSRLVPYERNARTHTPEQIAQIIASIREFGFTAPILVDSEDGILAGHGRLAAAKEMGLPEVPVVVLDHLNEKQRRAYILADNRIAQNAGWDRLLLHEELSSLDFDYHLLGFDDADIKRLEDAVQLAALEEMAGTKAEPERQPESEEEEKEDDGDADATAESGVVYHVFSVNLLWDDREEVLAAIRAAKAKIHVDSTADALLHICREFNR